MRERDIFIEALEQGNPSERAALLDEACQTDAELRERVERLLVEHERQESFFLDAPPAGLDATVEHALSERPGTIIGPYKLLQQIGEGGMGVVFMAEQSQPIQRTVALKIIKPGMDTRQVIARFEAERQALAMMDHPNIAHVFDAGTTESGRPFFVMELVKGVPITEYCDQCNLTARERLELFVSVCRAIQHAHQKGVIHRDLKPSNVMVTMHDDKPVPKVIDFGVSKAMSHQLTEKTLFTAYGQMIGTPMYMSPEQAQLSGLDVDTRSDIYSLGVLLYEMVTSTTPFDEATLKRVGFDEMRRLIREEEPLRPSARVCTRKGDLLTTVADQRKIDPRKLSQSLRGEVDWIVMKALEKDRNRRYESANSMAADIERYLNDEPVQACPPSAIYRFRKFARRHKAAVVMAIVIGSALLLTMVGLAVSTILIAREQRATENALYAERQATERERRDSYFHRITLAHRELSADNLGRALQLLGECPEDLRQWEWDYLMRLCRVEPLILRDTADVRCVAFHPGGEQVAAACGDGTVKILEARTGKLIQTLRGHESDVFSVTFSSDGRHLASASADRTVRLWDVATGREVFQWPGHVGDVAGMDYAVAFSPDGRQLVAGGEDGIATIWDAADGREVCRLPEKHENTAVCVAYSPDGLLLATGSWGGVLRIWNSQTGQLLRKIPAHTHRMCAIVFRPDGRWLATASFDRTVKIWDATTGELLHTLRGHTGGITGLAFSHDGRRLFSGGEDRTVKVWDPLTEREVLNLRGHSLFCYGLASSPDGLRLASAGKDGTIRIWDATPVKEDEGLESITCKHDYEVWSVEFSPDGGYLASTGGYLTSSSLGNLTVRIWDARTCAPLRDLTLPPSVLNVFRVAFSPDGKRFAAAAGSRDGEATVNVWETATGREVVDEIRERGYMPFFVTFDPTGRYLVREGREHTVQVRDAATGKEVGVVGRHAMQIWGMAFSPDGQRLATASNDGTVKVWDWDPARLDKEQQPAITLDVRVDGYGNRVAFSPDSQRLATGGEEYTVKIWDAKSGELQHTLSGHTGDVFAVAFSRDGRWLATGGEDTTVRIWDTAFWKLRRTLRGHSGVVMSLAFSPDSQRLASGSKDHTMKVWDTSRWEKEPGR
jgi:WD40 repeat protein/serine/threonine protein kinase